MNPSETFEICPLHGNVILPECGMCRHGLEMRRRLMQLEKFDAWLRARPRWQLWGIAAVLGALMGAAVAYGL